MKIIGIRLHEVRLGLVSGPYRSAKNTVSALTSSIIESLDTGSTVVVDANQSWNVLAAVEVGRALEDTGTLLEHHRSGHQRGSDRLG